MIVVFFVVASAVAPNHLHKHRLRAVAADAEQAVAAAQEVHCFYQRDEVWMEKIGGALLLTIKFVFVCSFVSFSSCFRFLQAYAFCTHLNQINATTCQRLIGSLSRCQ